MIRSTDDHRDPGYDRDRVGRRIPVESGNRPTPRRNRALAASDRIETSEKSFAKRR